ncbi:MAG: sugar phosphate nucleotidyltransferase, partial [Bacteroidota bacterium]
MSIKKAVITAAARGSRLYPVSDTVQKAMLPIVDKDGITKPVIQVIAEEALSGGVEEVCIICAPGDEPRYLEAFRSLANNLSAKENKRDWSEIQVRKIKDLMDRLYFRVQEDTLGYGHAVLCTKDYVKDDSFLLLL